MEYSLKARAVYSIIKEIEKDKISFEHKLQRKAGQWNAKQKSKLIHSILHPYIILPLTILDEEGTWYVIDGVQRLTTIYDYVKNKFALSKNMEPIVIEGKEYDLAAKKYCKLDEEVRSAIDVFNIQFYVCKNSTEKEVREMFARENSGKPLNNTQKRVVIEDDNLSSIICSITSHPFFNKVISGAQTKKDIDKDVAREILMLTEASNDYDFGSFRSKDIDAFVEYYNDRIDMDKVNLIMVALDKLNESIDENVKIKQTSLPMICYGMYRIIKDKKSTSKYLDWVHNFLDTYDNNEEYAQFCGKGTANADMVKGRLNYFREAIRSM